MPTPGSNPPTPTDPTSSPVGPPWQAAIDDHALAHGLDTQVWPDMPAIITAAVARLMLSVPFPTMTAVESRWLAVTFDGFATVMHEHADRLAAREAHDTLMDVTGATPAATTERAEVGE